MKLSWSQEKLLAPLEKYIAKTEYYFAILYTGIEHPWSLVSAEAWNQSSKDTAECLYLNPQLNLMHVLSVKNESSNVKCHFEFHYIYLNA